MPANSVSLVPGFPQTNGTIHHILLHRDRLYVCGQFTTIGGVSRNSLAALDPLTFAVLPWFPTSVIQAGDSVFEMAAIDDTLYVVGTFNSGGRSRAAAFDLVSNGLLTSWDPDLDAPGLTITTDGTSLFVGGYFTSIKSGATTRNFAAAFDNNLGAVLPWDPDFDSPVLELKVANSKVYAVGNFNSVNGGTTRNYAAAVDLVNGTVDAWDPDLDSDVNGIDINGSTAYLAGTFSSVNAGAFTREAVAAVDSTTGAALPFVADLGSGIGVTVKYNPVCNMVFIGGGFSLVNGLYNRFACVVDPVTGANAPANISFENGLVNVFEFSGNLIYVGGAFDFYKNKITKWNLISFDPNGNKREWATVRLSSSPEDPSASQVRCMAYGDGVIYISGYFDEVIGQNGTFSRSYAAAIDPDGNVLPWAPTLTQPANNMTYKNGRIYLGQALHSGAPANTNPVIDTAGNLLPIDFGINVGGIANRILEVGGSIYVGGDFTSAGGGTPRNSLAKFDLSGNLDLTWDPNVEKFTFAFLAATIEDMDSDGSYLYVVGNIARVNGATTRIGNFRVPLSSDVVDPAWVFDNNGVSIASLVVKYIPWPFSDVVIISGNFVTINGVSRNGIAMIGAATPTLRPWAVDQDPLSPVADIAFSNSFVTYFAASLLKSIDPIVPSQPEMERLGAFAYAFSPDIFTSFAPNIQIDPQHVVSDGVNSYFAGTIDSYDVKSADGFAVLSIPAAPPQGLPVAPNIQFLNRKKLPDGRTLTMFKWSPVFKDVNNNPITVSSYRIYRTVSMNLEDPTLIAEITTRDIRGFIDTMFTEEINGFFKYCVSAVNGVGEGGKSCAVTEGLAQSDRIE